LTAASSSLAFAAAACHLLVLELVQTLIVVVPLLPVLLSELVLELRCQVGERRSEGQTNGW